MSYWIYHFISEILYCDFYDPCDKIVSASSPQLLQRHSNVTPNATYLLLIVVPSPRILFPVLKAFLLGGGVFATAGRLAGQGKYTVVFG